MSHVTFAVLMAFGMSACSGGGGVTPSASADLTESGVAVVGGSMLSAGTIQVSDTVSNSGAGSADASVTAFYLNSSPVKGGSVIGTRAIGKLAAGTSSVSASTTLSLPLNLAGQYYVVACANDNGGVTETNTANDCAASTAFSITGADLTVTAVSTNPALAVPSGTAVAITDITSDAMAPAEASSTSYYLSQTPNLVTGASSVLGTRSVPALAASASSQGSLNVTIPISTTPGSYYLFACANSNNAVVEGNVNNNCASIPVVVYAPTNTVLVDQTNSNATNANCGIATTPCLTITGGVTAAKAGQTVLVFPGTYTEQVSITKSITLSSVTPYGAVIQAPVMPTFEKTLLTIDGGISGVVVSNMTISGPVETDGCGNTQGTYLVYGIFVKNADASIINNKILNIAPANSSLDGCQYGVGIRFGSRALAYIGHTGTISNNIVSGYAKGGIVVDGDGTNVTLSKNTVTGLQVVNVVGQNGIQISRGATGTVDSNTVSGNIYGVTLQDLSADGILLYDVVGGVTVTNNSVSGNDEGIGVYSDAAYDSSSNPVQVATKVSIKNNHATNNVYLGIHIDPFSSGNTIWDNTDTGNNGGWDDLDEHPNYTFNDWGSDPSQYDTVGISGRHVGLVFTY